MKKLLFVSALVAAVFMAMPEKAAAQEEGCNAGSIVYLMQIDPGVAEDYINTHCPGTFEGMRTTYEQEVNTAECYFGGGDLDLCMAGKETFWHWLMRLLQEQIYYNTRLQFHRWLEIAQEVPINV